MKALNKKLLTISMIASLLLVGCASTDPYTPQSNDDFVYDPDASFAMNVVEGSLGLHNGLRDADIPESSDVSSSGLDYAADGIIGAAFGGGMGGAFLSILGGNSSDAPLNHAYGIAYIPVDSFSKDQNEIALKTLSKMISIGATEMYGLEFSHTFRYKSSDLYVYHGDECLRRPNLFEKHQDEIGVADKLDCVATGHYAPVLLARTTVTPDGTVGKFFVFGLPKMSYLTFIQAAINIPSKSELGEFYYFVPVSYQNSIPFVYFDKQAHLFIKPDEKTNMSINIRTLEQLSPKLFGK
ncbi:hypothetical protein ABIS04_13720 [Shewanella sp. H8]|uniref:hypothetical protein n=1 Tax=Shewanella sp. H8 TaxID=3342676 RepID=UPI00331621BE